MHVCIWLINNVNYVCNKRNSILYRCIALLSFRNWRTFISECHYIAIRCMSNRNYSEQSVWFIIIYNIEIKTIKKKTNRTIKWKTPEDMETQIQTKKGI